MPRENKNFLLDSWLSALLERDAYNVVMDDGFASTLKESKTEESRHFDELQDGPVFMYSRVAPSLVPHVSLLVERGFRLIDTNITFQKRVTHKSTIPAGSTIRFAQPEDEDETVELSRKAFEYSRFHLDSGFQKETADQIKAEWVRNYFRGKRGDSMVLALIEGRIVGFLQLLYAPAKTLVIDLIAVDRNYRKRGIAAAMIAYAEDRCPGLEIVRVGTQITNIPSIKLYETTRFSIFSFSYVLHFHNPRS